MKRIGWMPILVLVVFFGLFCAFGGGKRMPTDRGTMEAFVAHYKETARVMKKERFVSSWLRMACIAKKSVEALGYDYDATFIEFMLSDGLREGRSTVEAWAVITSPRTDLKMALAEKLISRRACDLAEEKKRLAGLNDFNMAVAEGLLRCSKESNSDIISSVALFPLLKEMGVGPFDPNALDLGALEHRGLVTLERKIDVASNPPTLSGEGGGKKGLTINYVTEFKILDKKRVADLVARYERLRAVARGDRGEGSGPSEKIAPDNGSVRNN